MRATPPIHRPGLFRLPAIMSTLRFKLAMVGFLSVSLGWMGLLTFQYQQTRRPVTDLPALPPVGPVLPKTPPAFLKSVYAPSGNLLSGPLGVAVSPRGDRIYVTESTGERVTMVFDRDGTAIRKLEPPNSDQGARMPLYVALDPAGVAYVSDRMRRVIDRYSPEGEYLGTYQPADNAPRQPMALAFDRAGNFYVTDVTAGQHQLLSYDAQQRFRFSMGKEGEQPGNFSFPNGIAIDQRGQIYVADSNNGRVQIFNQDRQLLGAIGAGGVGTLGMPRGLVVDDNNRLFLVDTIGQSVEVWDTTTAPKRLYVIGSEGVGAGQYQYPNGIAVDTTGRVYVTDRVNNRLLVWSY
ncbi:MAG: hypothetical protein IT307_02660 [Chloroflexi bacterium]|nr:hypothetical protein [Chloroflexota bacterium]